MASCILMTHRALIQWCTIKLAAEVDAGFSFNCAFIPIICHFTRNSEKDYWKREMLIERKAICGIKSPIELWTILCGVHVLCKSSLLRDLCYDVWKYDMYWLYVYTVDIKTYHESYVAKLQTLMQVTELLIWSFTVDGSSGCRTMFPWIIHNNDD